MNVVFFLKIFTLDFKKEINYLCLPFHDVVTHLGSSNANIFIYTRDTI